jgi:hypothetical protein
VVFAVSGDIFAWLWFGSKWVEVVGVLYFLVNIDFSIFSFVS